MEVALQQKGGQIDDNIFSRGFSVLVLGCRDPYGTFCGPFSRQFDSHLLGCFDGFEAVSQTGNRGENCLESHV